MKTFFWTVLVLGALGACSSDEAGSGSNADCSAINAACEDSSQCCPGSLCAASFNNPFEGTCTQICESAAECDTGCCHALEDSEHKVCDIAIACENGSGGTVGTGGSGGSTGQGGAAPTGEGGDDGSTPACTDADAPGAFPFDALQLDATSDCNDTALVHSGEVLTPDESDWFSYQVTDEGLCAVEASAHVTGGEMQLCAFGDLTNCNIACTTGTATNHEGYDGCCVVGRPSHKASARPSSLGRLRSWRAD